MSEVNKKTLQNSMRVVYEIKTVPAVHNKEKSDKGTALRVYRIQNGESIANVSIERINSRKSNKELEITIEQEDASYKETWIRTPHKNCMQAKFETQRPEELAVEIEATIDTFTKKESPFNIDNFGDSSNLVVSGDNTVKRETFIRFELPLWFLPTVSTETRMRLYYRGTINENDSLIIHRNSREWSEYSLTYANSPNKSQYVTNEFVINNEERYIEFDLTELVNDWKLRPEFNFGINISSADGKRFSFYSRESAKPPLLLGTYYDPNIKSIGRATKEALIEVKQRGDDDRLVVIEPKPYYTTLDKNVHIKFYEKGGLIPDDIGTELTVTKPHTNVKLGVYEPRETGKNVVINNLKKGAILAGTQVTVTREKANVLIDTPNFSDKEVAINVQGTDDKNVELEIVYGNSIDIELSAIAGSQKEVALTVSRQEAGTEIFVMESDDKEVVIQPKVNGASEELTQLTTTKRTKSVTIIPKVKSMSDKDTELNAKGWEHSNIHSQIAITRQIAGVELTAHKSTENREVELYVNDTVDKETVIKAISSSSKNVNLNVVEVSDTNARITVTKVEVGTQLGVYFEENSEPIVEITPRMRRTSNRKVTISVKGDNLGYAFIM